MAKRFLKLSSLVASVATVAGVSLGASSLSAGPAAAADSCPKTQLLVVPGTWETNSSANPSEAKGMLKAMTDVIKQKTSNSQIGILYVPYKAQAFTEGTSYTDSRQSGIDQAKGMIASIAARCPSTTFEISGYSQGADVAGTVVSDIGNGKGPIPASRMVGGYTFADPGRGGPGEETRGPVVQGTGLAGARKAGYGGIPFATVCYNGDRYCNISAKSNKLGGVLGDVLAHNGETQAAAQTSSASERSNIVANFDNASVGNVADYSTGLTTAAKALQSGDSQSQQSTDYTQAGSLQSNTSSTGNPSLTSLANIATNLISTLQPLGATATTLNGATDVQNKLKSAQAGSSENAASSVLDATSKTDVNGAVNTANSLLSAANSGNTTQAITDANTLNKQIQPLASQGTQLLSQSANVMQGIQPASLLNQASNIVTGFSSFDYNKAISTIPTLAQQLSVGDVFGAHTTAETLAKTFTPLVKMADNVDYGTIANLVTLAGAAAGAAGHPEVTAGCAVAAQVLNIVNKLDMMKIFDNIFNIQHSLVNMVQNPNTVGKELPTVVNQGMQLVSQSASVAGLPNMSTDTLTQAASTLSMDDIVSGGLDLAQFYGSQAHGEYPKIMINGVSSLADGANWLIAKAS